MSGIYRIAVKESVLRETGLSRDDFEEELELGFTDKEAAKSWVDEQNQLLSATGQLTLHTAHPNDSSDVSAYLVFRPSGVWTIE